MKLFTHALACLLVGCVLGCASRSFYSSEHFTPSPRPGDGLVIDGEVAPAFAGPTGRSLSISDLRQGIEWAHVIVLGEIHDDARGHAIQTAIVRLAAEASAHGVLSMEMLERDDAPAALDYSLGKLSLDEFIDRTKSRDWAGKDTWLRFYQPSIDAAREREWMIIAANAPRKYVRLARTDGYDALRALPPEEQLLFSIPRKSSHGGYQERFVEWATTPEDDASSDHDSSSRSQALIGFRSQLMWDSTMADSIAKVLEAMQADFPDAKVVHLVGQFHSDFEGGTIQELRARVPDVRVLTVSVQPVNSVTLRGDDRGRADIVIYSGEPPETKVAESP